MSECKWCGREDEGNAGDYYHKHACHARDVLRRIEIEGRTPELLRELESARNVGD